MKRPAALLALAVLSACAGEPARIDVAELERRFDRDPDAALRELGGRPVVVRGKVASVHDDRVTLQSIYVLDVQAYTTWRLDGLAEGQSVELACGGVDRADYLTGAKPVLRDCTA